MRPPRTKIGLNTSVSQEQTLETLVSRLEQIGDQVTGIGDQVSGISSEVSDINQSGKLLKMNLLGGYEAETVHGRIPKLEMTVGEIDVRVTSLENAYMRNGERNKAYGVVIGIVAGFASSIFTGGVLLLIRYFLFGAKI
jgi:hypothetical protein